MKKIKLKKPELIKELEVISENEQTTTENTFEETGEENIHVEESQQAQTSKEEIDFDVFSREYQSLGKFSYEEVVILILFIILLLLWTTRSPIGIFPGWGFLFGEKFMTDGTVAVFVAFWLFVVPSKNESRSTNDTSSTERKMKSTAIMDWDSMLHFPWEIILLFGGGFALADGFIVSGLTKLIAESMTALQAVPSFIMVLVVCASVLFITEVCSNVATAQIFLPILASISIAIKVNIFHEQTHSTKVHPLMLMIPATVCCSFAFMLPVATAPNMIVFVTKRYVKIYYTKSKG